MAPSASDEARVLAACPSGLLVAGEEREAADGRRLPVVDPATERTLTDVADAAPTDAVAALDAACDAGPAWAATPPRERGEVLRRAFELMHERTEDLALLMTLEMGKPLASSRAEIAYAAEFFRWFSEEAVRAEGRWSRRSAGGGQVLVTKRPVGPCLLVTPWNFPTAMGTRKIGPALAAGCTAVVKPAAQTPLSMLALGALLADAGLPDGVVNVLPTSRAADLVAPVLADPRLRKLSFTGSTPVGRTLVEQSAAQLLRTSMELGGNAPLLVFADADLDVAVEGAFQAKTRNLGESCVAANRLYVQEEVAEEFSSRLAERMGAMTLGRGTEDGVEVGPLVDGSQRDSVRDLVDDAVGRGARALCGGGAPDGPGFFVEPTVLVDVDPRAALLSQEVFGPVAPVLPFRDEEEAVARADDTAYGLVAYVFTRDLDRAFRVVEGLEVGMVGVNTGVVSDAAAPFGGAKASGFGREGGHEGLEEYLLTQYVALASGA